MLLLLGKEIAETRNKAELPVGKLERRGNWKDQGLARAPGGRGRWLTSVVEDWVDQARCLLLLRPGAWEKLSYWYGALRLLEGLVEEVASPGLPVRQHSGRLVKPLNLSTWQQCQWLCLLWKL